MVNETPPSTLHKNGSLSRLADIEETEKADSSSVDTSSEIIPNGGDSLTERPSLVIDQTQRNNTVSDNGQLDADRPSLVYDYQQRRDSKMFLRRPSGNPNLYNNIEKRVSISAITPHRLTNGRRSGTISVKERRSTLGDVKRRTAFMDNNINRYHDRLRNTDISMKNAIETMPLSKYE